MNLKEKVILFYKANEENDGENSVATIIDEVVGFGLYIEVEGVREVVTYQQITGWREVNQDTE